MAEPVEDNAIIGLRDEAFDLMHGGGESFVDWLIELGWEASIAD